MSADGIARGMAGEAQSSARTIQTIVNALTNGFTYIGAVDYYDDLPTSDVSVGDVYTVKYTGSSGTDPDRTNYVWGLDGGSNAWIAINAQLAVVAYTGAYNDLSGRPSLATVATSGKYTDLTDTPNLATVATTGDYDDLANKPTIIDDYDDLDDKPQVNGVTLTGNKSTSDLGIVTVFPLVDEPAWNAKLEDGLVTPDVTLPDFGTPTTEQTFIYSFTAKTTGAEFTAPADAMLIDSTGAEEYEAENTLTLSDLTAGAMYECVFSCFSATVVVDEEEVVHNYIVLKQSGVAVA